MSSPANPPSTTFLFCVESGYFEAQTILAIESLRQFGGRFAQAPVLAVTPRRGPQLTRTTLNRFDELGVTYVRHNFEHPQTWYCYLNKALTTMAAETHATTEQVVWMDSDTVIIDEPDLLWLEPEIDFAICSTDKNVGSSGPNDPNEAYWLALSQYYGVDIDQLPWVITACEQERVRFRLHSGVFAFRRESGLGTGYVKACEKMLDSRIGYSRNLPFPGDDVALAFAIVLLKLRWRLLPLSYNYETLPASIMYQRDALPSAQVLHYHYALMTPPTCAWLLEELRSQRPDVYAWLKERTPLNPKVGGMYRTLVRRFLKEWRSRQQKQIESSCTPAVVEA